MVIHRHVEQMYIFRRPMSAFRVVRCSSVHCFQTRITVELFRGARTTIVLQGYPPSRRPICLPRSKSVSYWDFTFFRRGAILRPH